MTYAVKEAFLTVQGEGGQAGRPAVFLRFAGCNLWSGREQDRAEAVCSFCDTEFVGTDGDGGGKFRTAMQGPDGFASDETGVFLEVIANRRLVFTDAYKPGWEPSEAPFMTSVIDFADEGGKTRYVATALHWTVADRKRHEEMGFHEGWGAAADQLAALAASL